jgi:lipopolysaccharide assembly outer membrane protein LptD (OstA)
MKRLRKFSLKKMCLSFVVIAFCMTITLNCEAQRTKPKEIYTTLTTDTIPPKKKDSLPLQNANDTLPKKDSLAQIKTIDTFSLKFSKDTLDAPVNYEASDSGVLLIKEKKFLLYGNTKTTYNDIKLTAPKIELDQATNILTAVNSKDSLGNIIARARFESGTDGGFQSDTIRFNFKTKKGITTNTYSKQQDLFVQAQFSKKINDSVTFVKHFTMTSCEYDEPHFGFVSNKGKFINNKIAITGPIHPEFEGVPIPIYLPFGMFPLNQQRHSGLLAPQFTVNEQFGLGLEGLGYYHVLNEYLDVTLRTNIYSYGGWTANIIPSYRKRYHYQGSLSLSIQHNKTNFKGDPDYSLAKTFNIAWTHSIDQKARPGTNFSANVNAGSTRFNRYVTNDPNRNFQNQLYSSITYTKTWQDKPFNLSLSANHNQNNETQLINLTLPDAGFTVTTLYPFQKKKPIGTPKWYEKVGVGYSGVARNQVSFYDYDTAKINFNKILDTLQWGAQHRFPVNVSLPPLGPVLVSPFISYEETWLTRRISRRWNDGAKKIDTLYDKKGLFIDRQMSFGIGLNTALYGTKLFKKGKITGIRHTMRPNLNFNYKPNLSKRYYDVIRTDSANPNPTPIPQFGGGNLFGSYGYGKFGGITFGVDNNLEMKKRGRKDTVEKKFKLIDGWGFTSGYNFLQDSMKLLPFNLYLRTTLFEKLSISANALYNPYQRDPTGRYIDRFVWQGDRFRLGKINGGNISMSTSFQSKPRDAKKAEQQPKKKPVINPNDVANRERLEDYIQKNPAEFVDFNLPWSVSLSLALSFNEERRADNTYKTKVSSNVSFNNSFSLTPKWNFSTNGYYDFSTGKLQVFTMSISREMHCWQMSINVTPIGQTKYFNISISPKSPLLQDLHVNRTRYFQNY